MAFTPLNALHAFLAVARRRSFAAAARELGVSTSALSQAVKQLEARLGIALLTRTSRSVALTDAGQRLLETAGPAVDQALESLRTVQSAPGEVTGRLRLSVPWIAVPLVLVRLVPLFSARYPKVALDVRVENRFVNIVADGIDAGIRLVEAIDRDMIHVRLSPPERVVVAAAPAYIERRGAPLTPEDLLQHDCVGMRPEAGGDPFPWELERGKKDWRVPVRGPLTTNSPELSLAFALAGGGLIYGLESGFAHEIARGRLRVVLEAYAPTVPGLFLYFPRHAHISPVLRAFVDLARAATTEATRKTRSTTKRGTRAS